MRWILAFVVVLLPALGGQTVLAGDFSKTLAMEHAAQAQGFEIIGVSILAPLLADRSAKVVVFDADNDDDRAVWGVIPGAKLLSSFDNYDVVRELPKDKSTRLVIYSVSER